jgi:hypothetical protein
MPAAVKPRNKNKSVEKPAEAAAQAAPPTGGVVGGKGPTIARPGQASVSIARPTGVCAVTGQAIAAGTKLHAALRETPVGIERIDVLPEQWANVNHDDLLAHWTAVMPAAGEKPKKLLVDDEVLLSVFGRLSETQEVSKLAFRFVLGLILMRKRLVVYEGAKKNGAGRDVWMVRLRGTEDILELVDPRLSSEQISDLAGQLTEIVAGEDVA